MNGISIALRKVGSGEEHRMNTRRWIRGALQALSLALFLAVLVACDLQQQEEESNAFYRLEASGLDQSEPNGHEIAVLVYFVNPSGEQGYLGDTHQGAGWWRMDIDEGLVRTFVVDTGCFFLRVRATAMVDGMCEVGTRISHFDNQGNLLADSTSCQAWAEAISSISLPPPSIGEGNGSGGGVMSDHPLSHWNPPPTGTVVCTELHRQGLMDEAIFAADQAFGKHLGESDSDVMRGYHFWARPVVSLMQRSHAFTQVVNILAKPWSYEMAHRMGATDKGSVAGKILMDVGVPLCRAIGRIEMWVEDTALLGVARDHAAP
jgi:hypothetical protein